MTTPPGTHAGMPRDDDREALSALFDGELDPHGRLFATRRLSHDAEWQADCGRWQLIGDAMRRQAPIAAPASFAVQVGQAVAAERAGKQTSEFAALRAVSRAAPVATSRRTGTGARWAGGALAASLALAAVLVARPFDSVPLRAHQPAAVATVPTPTRSASVTSAAEAVASPGAGPSMAASPAQIAAAATTAAAPDNFATTKAAAAPAQPAPLHQTFATVASRPSNRGRAQATAGSSTGIAGDASTGQPLVLASNANPFALPAASAIPARPWPRAVLGGRGDAGLAAGFRHADGSSSAPSFYPFEPAPAATVQGEAQAP